MLKIAVRQQVGNSHHVFNSSLYGDKLSGGGVSLIDKILHFFYLRLVYDRESGKPKGYGFCEYKDLETAQSAMRNLNGVELHGRNLRVDSAASEKGKEEGKGDTFFSGEFSFFNQNYDQTWQS